MSEKMLYRSLELSASPEGRTIVAPCIVPYNRVARVVDEGGLPYDECFAPGVFKRNLRDPARVLVRGQHGSDFLSIAGRALTLNDDGERLSGEFLALESPSGEQALAMVRAGIYKGASVGFMPIKSAVGNHGEVVRLAAHLDHVALVMEPAYADATALAIRQASVRIIDELRPIIDAELEKRLTALGMTRA
jgi:HK97 family phage prohead protease